MISTSLRNQLRSQKIELQKVRDEHDTTLNKARDIMEMFVINESIRESNELRQRLASDGARLGRLVTTRVSSSGGGGFGGRVSQIMEIWEDGSAPKLLAEKREGLRVKREGLERRRDELLRGEYCPTSQRSDSNGGGGGGSESRSSFLSGDTSSTLLLHVNDEESNSNTTDTTTNQSSNGFMMNDLDRLEANESIRMHLDEIRNEEIELEHQERALNIEKRVHVRALKLVSNEDSSKWRTHRKLHDRYVLMNLLGKGGFSEVWRAFDLRDMRHVAVKLHQLESSWSDAKRENYTKHVAREYEIHQSVRHPRIVSLYDVFEIDDECFATVLECCKGTDLDTVLKDRGKLEERDARSILMQILSGMRHLSTAKIGDDGQGIIHYDLKVSSFLSCSFSFT